MTRFVDTVRPLLLVAGTGLCVLSFVVSGFELAFGTAVGVVLASFHWRLLAKSLFSARPSHGRLATVVFVRVLVLFACCAALLLRDSRLLGIGIGMTALVIALVAASILAALHPERGQEPPSVDAPTALTRG